MDHRASFTTRLRESLSQHLWRRTSTHAERANAQRVHLATAANSQVDASERDVPAPRFTSPRRSDDQRVRRPDTGGYRHIAWRTRVDAPESLANLQARLLAHLDKEGDNQERVVEADEAVGRLISALARCWEGPIVASFSWGWSFPLITVTRRSIERLGAPPDHGLLELRPVLAASVVRERRIVASTDGSLKVVAVLNVSRHPSSTTGAQHEGEPA